MAIITYVRTTDCHLVKRMPDLLDEFWRLPVTTVVELRAQLSAFSKQLIHLMGSIFVFNATQRISNGHLPNCIVYYNAIGATL
jgi:hypothetical protein